jgi:hypothetical protein
LNHRRRLYDGLLDRRRRLRNADVPHVLLNATGAAVTTAAATRWSRTARPLRLLLDVPSVRCHRHQQQDDDQDVQRKRQKPPASAIFACDRHSRRRKVSLADLDRRADWTG